MGSLQMDDDDDDDDDDEISNYVDLHMYMLGGGWKWQDLQGLLWWIIIEKDAVTFLKRIQKFSVAQHIGARAAIHIFNRISFAIAKGVGAQIVSRLPFNLL
ncbi:hypothetical protein Tco_1001335 [Tanacetum coccineum]